MWEIFFDLEKNNWIFQYSKYFLELINTVNDYLHCLVFNLYTYIYDINKNFNSTLIYLSEFNCIAVSNLL